MRATWTMLVALTTLASGCDETVAPDAGADAGADAGVEVVCTFPDPLVAGTPETDALADAPARCGQPDHVWLRDPMLGTVTETRPPVRFIGTVLNSLAAAANAQLPQRITNNVTLRSFTYVTQDRGELIEATAMVAMPEGLPPGEELDVLVFPHGTTGYTDGCTATDDTMAQSFTAILAAIGPWIVVAPDYIGLKHGGPPTGFLHPYLVGQATAIASLDAVRAASRLAPADREQTCMSTRFATLGGSQGGHATLWIDRLAPYYARELTHLGAVATVPPLDTEGELARAMTQPLDASNSTAIFFATAADWYGLQARLNEVLLPPYDVDAPAALRAQCMPRIIDGDPGLDTVFTQPLRDAATAGTLAGFGDWGCTILENGLTTTSIPRLGGEPASYGVLMVTAAEDPLVHTPTERVAFEALCDAGTPMQYLECEGANHFDGTGWSIPDFLAFLRARFDEEPFTPACEPPPATRCMGTP